MATTTRVYTWTLLVCLLLQYVSSAKVTPKIRLEDIEEENNRKAQELKNAVPQVATKHQVIPQQGGFLPQQFYYQPQGIANYPTSLQGVTPQPQLYLGQREQIALLEAFGQQQSPFPATQFGHGLYGVPQGQQNIPLQYTLGVSGQGSGIHSQPPQQVAYALPASAASFAPQRAETVKIPAQSAAQIQYQQIQQQPALQKAVPQAQLQQQFQQQLQQQLLAQAQQQYYFAPQQQAAQAAPQPQVAPQQQRGYVAQVAPQAQQYAPQQQFYQVPQYLQQLSQQPQYTQQQPQLPQQYQQQQPQYSQPISQQPQYTPQISAEQLQQLFAQQYPQHAAQAQALQKAAVQQQAAQKVVQRQPAVQRYVPEPQQQVAQVEQFKPSRPIFQQPFVYPDGATPQRVSLQALPAGGGQVVYGFPGVGNQFTSGKASAAEAKRAGGNGQGRAVATLAGAGAFRKGSYTTS